MSETIPALIQRLRDSIEDLAKGHPATSQLRWYSYASYRRDVALMVASYELHAHQTALGETFDHSETVARYLEQFRTTSYHVAAEARYCEALLAIYRAAAHAEPSERAEAARALAGLREAHRCTAWWAPKLTNRLIRLLGE